MNFEDRVNNEITGYIEKIKGSQKEDGSWRYCFENGPMTDAYLIIILRILELDEEGIIKKLVQRLLTLQQANGAWRLFEDDEGNLSATIEAYTALLFSGYCDRTDVNLQKAESFIMEQGGVENAHVSTKFMLALNKLYPWPKLFPFPLFLIHLPSFKKFSSYVRAHFAPVFILGHTRFSIKNHYTPDLSHLFLQKKRLRRHKNDCKQSFSKLSSSALRKAETYMLERVEGDGTLSCYASATFYMIYALFALGYRPDSMLINNAVSGLKSYLFINSEEFHLQNSPSTIWDSSLLSYSLQEAGIPIEDPAIASSAKYLLPLQQSQGGWGFSETNTRNPDVDDTQAVLRAISRLSRTDANYRDMWNKGINWLLSMQHSKGGWGAFEGNGYRSLVSLLPIQNVKDTIVEPAAADLTGRTLEFLGNYAGMTVQNPRIKNAVNWLLEHQEENGSWYGRWGVSFIYGTWAAVTGLKAVGVPSGHPSIQKAIQWLKEIQHDDGGWGESCKSDQFRIYMPLSYSTLVQTAWAIDSLIAANETITSEIVGGIQFLLNRRNLPEKMLSYPTGAGLPGHFYIYYHSYNDTWPLIALAHFRNKYH